MRNIIILRAAFALVCIFCLWNPAKGQIGYQVSLLNTATGEPRANVSVSVNITLTNSANEVVHTETQQTTSNDFGVLSLTVGDANTFKNIDSGKLPLFIEVQVDGVTIGKSQIQNVPVAEFANNLKSSFTMEELVGTWESRVGTTSVVILTFNSNFSATIFDYYMGKLVGNGTGAYEVEGNNIYFYYIGHRYSYDENGNQYSSGMESVLMHFRFKDYKLWRDSALSYYTKK